MTIQINLSNFNAYFEPFVGGGVLFFALKSRVLEFKTIYLSDKNTELINTYQVIQKNPKALLKELESLQKITIKSFFIVFV
uniref:DNA adenine methylase n=1 Tax=Helicobacter sp. UBA3407 TaxID=1946588 RepID=UPI002630FFE7